MDLIEKFKRQSRITQILDIAFVICVIYEIILIIQNQSLNYYIVSLMLVILFIDGWAKLKNQLKVKIITYFNLFYFFKAEQLPEQLHHCPHHHRGCEPISKAFPDLLPHP